MMDLILLLLDLNEEKTKIEKEEIRMSSFLVLKNQQKLTLLKRRLMI
jgi:hypothetical protein